MNYFSDEHTGWKVELVYSQISRISFADLLINLKFDNEGNFVDEEIHNNLYNADDILLVFYAEDGSVKEELMFEGVKHVWNWFDAEHVQSSSHWDIFRHLDFTCFSLNPDPNNFTFEVTRNVGGSCEQTIHFRVVRNDTECEKSSDHGRGQQKTGALIFSEFKYPVLPADTSAAFKVKILTRNLTVDDYKLVFIIGAFAGVDAYAFYKNGALVAPDPLGKTFPSQLYRHPMLLTKIETATFIRFRIFDTGEKEIVSEVVFKGVNDFEGWFSSQNVVNSSLWNFEGVQDHNESTGSFFTIAVGSASPSLKLRNFYISQVLGDGCHKDRGWFSIVSVTGNSGKCPWEKWWKKKSQFKNYSVYQSPYILYSTISGADKNRHHGEAGKIEIAIK